VADIAMDYQRLGEQEFAAVEAVTAASDAPELQQQNRPSLTTSASSSSVSNNSNNNIKRSYMQCLLIEFDFGLVGVASCLGIDCLVIAVAKPDAPPGLIKARLQALAVHVQEAFSTLTEQAT
jgi:hypothetical protein